MANVADEIDRYRKDLREILNRKTDDDILRGLRELAPNAGALTRGPKSGGFIKEQIEELVQSINQALQTWAMIDACRTAAKNYRIAVGATMIALIAALAALATAGANCRMAANLGNRTNAAPVMHTAPSDGKIGPVQGG